jgi:hypothetical protein
LRIDTKVEWRRSFEPDKKTAWVSLVAGEYYPIRGIHRAAVNDDYISVGMEFEEANSLSYDATR